MFKKGQIVVYKETALNGRLIAEFVKEMYRNGDRMLVVEDQSREYVRVMALSGSKEGDEWNSREDRLELAELSGLEGAVKLV